MAGMKPTIIEALIACDGVPVAVAIKKLMADCGEDRDVCREVVGKMLIDKLIDFSINSHQSETTSTLTEAGRHYLSTHSSRKVAYTALDDILSEDGKSS